MGRRLQQLSRTTMLTVALSMTVPSAEEATQVRESDTTHLSPAAVCVCVSACVCAHPDHCRQVCFVFHAGAGRALAACRRPTRCGRT
jgi:hypothetical protein